MFGTASFFRVEMLVGFREQFLNALAVAAIDGDADACGKARLIGVFSHDLTDAIGNALGFHVIGFRQNKSKLIAAIASSGVDSAAVDAESLGETAESPAADQMAVIVVDDFEAVEVEEKNSEGPAGAVSALRFTFENVEETAVVGETGERVADSQVADLFEEVSVVQEGAAESKCVRGYGESLREDERRVEEPLGLASSKLGGEIQPSGRINGAVEGRVFEGQAAAIPNHRAEENCAGNELLRTGEKCARMPRNFRRKVAKSHGQQIGESDNGDQGAGNLAARMTRSRDEAFDEQSDKQ